MLLSSTTGLVIVALVLIGGWLLGLASSSGGKTWKARYLAERDAHHANRKIADDRIAELEREHRTYRTATDERIAAAERARAADTVAANRSLATDPVASDRPRAFAAARPAYPAGERRGWFDFRR